MCTSLHVSTFSDTIVTILGGTVGEVEDFMIQVTEFISEKVTREPHIREILAGFNPRGGTGGQMPPQGVQLPPKHMTPSTIPLLPC